METLKFTTDSIRIEGAVGGGIKVSFFTHEMDFSQDLMHKYEGTTYTVKMSPKKENRSLDANAYMWSLLGRESQCKQITLTKEELYRQAIKDYGVAVPVPIKDDLVESVSKWHEEQGDGNRSEIIGASKFAGYTNVLLYYGSSGYDTKQMSNLIDGIIRDCQELGVETKSPEEVERMMKQWKDG